jgi:endonuclease/exonuclease/phosphatase family metal-dependent hydrolase
MHRPETEINPHAFHLRVMTYNIHSCLDRRGRICHEETAVAIGSLKPDLVALQEVDNGVPRTGQTDQARFLAKQTGMIPAFCPTVTHPRGHYGIAVLSRYSPAPPRCGRLPVMAPFNFQQRGIVHLTVRVADRKLHLFNTHLSLFGLERRRQIAALLGKHWIGSVPAEEPVIVCGDLNTGPRSPVYRRLARILQDVQTSLRPSRTWPTFSSRRPLFRLDHIFVSPHFSVRAVNVPRHEPFPTVSDHLPLVAELTLDGRRGTSVETW